MQHSPEGIEADPRQREFHDEWVRKWLNYYRQCDGYGGHHYTENGAPHGAGFWPMDMPVPLVRRKRSINPIYRWWRERGIISGKNLGGSGREAVQVWLASQSGSNRALATFGAERRGRYAEAEAS